MKISKFSIFLLVTPLLFSCGETKLKQISDEEASKLAAEIVSRHKDPSLFKIPETFSYKEKTLFNYDNYTVESGKSKGTNEEIKEINFDIPHLVYRIYIEEKSDLSSSYKEEIAFYDNATGTLYNCCNYNGYKIRYEVGYSQEEAKNNLIDMLKYNWEQYDMSEDSFLTNFDNNLKSWKELHEKYKNEKDQHFDYSFGSDDAKSFQRILDYKYKNELVPGDEYDNVISGHLNVILKNDMFLTGCFTSKLERTFKDDKNFYVNTNSEKTANLELKASISIPKYEDYILVKN